MATASFRGVNLKMPKGAFKTAIKRESPKRRRKEPTPGDDNDNEIEEELAYSTEYGSDEFNSEIGDKPILILQDGTSFILPEGTEPTELAETAGEIDRWDRDGIVRNLVGKPGWSAAVKSSATEAAEWDHVSLSLSRQAGQEVTPEQIKQATAILADVLRTPPLRFTRDNDTATFDRWVKDKKITRGDILGIDGNRLLHMLPVHENTDNVHVQAFVHRHPVDIEKREIGAAIKQHENVVTNAQTAVLNALFETNELPFTVQNGFIRVNAGQGATLDTEQAAEVIKTIEDAGGSAPARLQTGMTGQMQGQVSTIGITPDVQKISASVDEDAQMLARMKSDMDALAARIAAKQNAIAAIQDAAQARLELEAERQVRENLEGTLAEREQALETAAVQIVEMTATIEEAKIGIAQAQEYVDAEPDRTAAAVTEAVQPVAEMLETVEASLADVETRLVAAEGVIAGEPERIAMAVTDAVQPVAQRADAAEATIFDLQGELGRERAAREHAQHELDAERRALPERISAAIADALSKARQSWDREIADPLREQMTAMMKEFGDMMRNSLRGQVAPVEAPATVEASATVNRTWYSRGIRPFEKMSDVEQKAANLKLSDKKSTGEEPEDVNIKDYVERIQTAYISENDARKALKPK